MKVLDKPLSLVGLDSTKQKNEEMCSKNAQSFQGNHFDFGKYSDACKIYFTANSGVTGESTKHPQNAAQAADMINSVALDKKPVYKNVEELYQAAIDNKEVKVANSGTIVLDTGDNTGRAPKARVVVKNKGFDEGKTYKLNWCDTNKSITESDFNKIFDKFTNYLKDKKVYTFDGFAGAEDKYKMPVRFVTELAAHNLFAHHLFINPPEGQEIHKTPQFTVIDAPGLQLGSADGENIDSKHGEGIVINLKKGIILIAGTKYSGEMKKSIFSAMNYLLPQQGVLTMHCAANVSKDDPDNVALFYGLSGTGKTTLSTDENRKLIGDDEHGWGPDGVFNIEGGCYPKCINLSEESEPGIHAAMNQRLALAENVNIDEKGDLDFSNKHLPEGKKVVENSRGAYPLNAIEGAVLPSKAGHPKTIVFLTMDSTGTLPPISRLEGDQIKYHLMSGYTSKTGGTENGAKDEITFSSCFGEPFLPLSPKVYADMLVDKIKEQDDKGNKINVFLLNTGWSGGPKEPPPQKDGTPAPLPPGINKWGQRISIKTTRALLNAALDGKFNDIDFVADDTFKLPVPVKCPDAIKDVVKSSVLDPKNAWTKNGNSAYDDEAKKLANLFVDNFEKKYSKDCADIAEAGPNCFLKSGEQNK